ncbi:MAG: 23S rRNA (uracil(1939)-C(5))-methyltransferase RlmD [Bacteroidales bacterium]|nr:23S rRNA (uracil(1939)-C(5))-methyltransferase RlmD [Bacteroidales bacterium]
MRKKKGNIREGVHIESFAAEGNALTHVNGKVLFVSMAVPGDVANVRVLRKRKHYEEGVIDQLITPSPLRVDPFCEHFGICGGCRWQHVPYEKQLEFKQQQVFDQLSRVGKLDLPPLLPILGSENTQAYRNKLEFTFSNKGWIPFEELKESQQVAVQAGEAPVISRFPALGFHVRGRFDRVLGINNCYLQPSPSNEIRRFVRNYALENNLSFFDLRQQTGFLRTLMIRNTSDGLVMVVVVFAHDNPDQGEDHTARTGLLDKLQAAFSQISSLYYMINTKKNDSLFDLEAIHYGENPYLTEAMDGLQFTIGPKSFYQTNTHQAARLYRKVREFAALQGDETVYDLYTGTGTIALYLAGHCRHVTGIEYVPEAIEDAKANAQANDIKNSAFFTGDIKDVLTPDFIERQGKPDVVVLDPPRAGVHSDVLQVLKDVAPQRIVYVSCNPATQARDLNLLMPHYNIVHVQPIDMFPHTHHIENIVVAEKHE